MANRLSNDSRRNSSLYPMTAVVTVVFSLYVLDEILNLIESVSEDFPSYSLPVVSHGVDNSGTSLWSVLSEYHSHYPEKAQKDHKRPGKLARRPLKYRT